MCFLSLSLSYLYACMYMYVFVGLCVYFYVFVFCFCLFLFPSVLSLSGEWLAMFHPAVEALKGAGEREVEGGAS